MPAKNQRNGGAASGNSGKSLKVSKRVTPQVSKYYLKISKRYRTACAASLIALLVYIVFIIGAYGEYITYANIQYLLRDLDTIVSSEGSPLSRITYKKQNEMTFSVFRNILAAAGKETVSLYDSSGLLLCEDQMSFADPILVPSDKYLLAYDIGGKGYAVYNSMTRIISRQADHRIVDGDMSDSGSFLLVTRSNETKYVVELYNSALNHTMSIYKDNYVMDAAINSDGNIIAVCSALPSDTDFNCEIAFYAPGNSEMINKIILYQTMPLYAKFLSCGNLAVMCDKALYIYDGDGLLINSYSFSGMTLEYADISDELIVLSGSENALGNENRIIVFSNTGDIICNNVIKERVTAVCAPVHQTEHTAAYVLTPDEIIKIKISESEEGTDIGEIERLAVKDEEVLAIRAAENGIAVCTATGAYYAFN